MPQHVEHFQPLCDGCLLEAADVLLLVLLGFLVMASVRHRLRNTQSGPKAT